jgi:hypothetical protein
VDAGWIALRSAATLVHAVPGVAARVRLDGRLVADVARGAPAEGAATEATGLSPCAFRRWVADEWARSATTEEPTGWGAHETRLSVEVGIPVCGSVLPGGVYRVPTVDRHVYVIAIAGGGDAVRTLAEELAAERGGAASASRLCLRLDPLTEVALAYCEVAPRDQHEVEPFVVELLTTLAGRVAVDQLVRWVDEQPARRRHDGAALDDLG